MLLAMGLLAFHAAVFDEEAGSAVLELDGVLVAIAPAVGADIISRQNAAHVGTRTRSPSGQ